MQKIRVGNNLTIKGFNLADKNGKIKFDFSKLSKTKSITIDGSLINSTSYYTILVNKVDEGGYIRDIEIKRQ